jgi:transposase
MNVQLANAISDLSGVTGMAIVRAILAGERDPWQLAKLRDRRIQASEEEIAHSLEGHWQEDVLFELKQVVEAYDFHQKQITSCDTELQKYLAKLASREPAGGAGNTGESTGAVKQRKRSTKRKANDNRPNFDLGAELERLMGVDLRIIDGLDLMTVQTVYSELGADLSAWPSEKHFTSWLELSPRRDISGGKVIRQAKRQVRNRVANALRNAAQSLIRSDSYLGARYRHLRARLGGLKAVKAMARYLACLIYRLLTKGPAWVDRGAAYYESKREERELQTLHRKAAAKGLKLVPVV